MLIDVKCMLSKPYKVICHSFMLYLSKSGQLEMLYSQFEKYMFICSIMICFDNGNLIFPYIVYITLILVFSTVNVNHCKMHG